MPSPVAKTMLPLFFLINLVLLCSFAEVPVEKNKVASSTQQKRVLKKKERLRHRLYQLEQSNTKAQRQKKIKKRLYKIEQQQKSNDAPSYTLGLLSMGAGILGVLSWLGAVIASFALAFASSGFAIVFVLVMLALAFGITGLSLALVFFSKRRKNPDAYSHEGFAIAGLILSTTILLLGAILILGATL